MTPLGYGILTGLPEVDDPQINRAMDRMLAHATKPDLEQTVLEMSALVTVLCGALGDCSDTSTRDVLDCVLSR